MRQLKKIILIPILSMTFFTATISANNSVSNVIGWEHSFETYYFSTIEMMALSGNLNSQSEVNESKLYHLKEFNQALIDAKNGDADALVILGDAYTSNDGLIPVNYGKAFELYSLAAQKGVRSANNRLGDFYSQGLYVHPDEKKAFEYYLKGENYREVAQAYLHGKGVKEDEKKAIEYFILGMNYVPVGNLYFNDGNYNEAMKYYLKTLNESDNFEELMEANYKLGEIYFEGLGVKKDIVKASEYYQRVYQSYMEAKDCC